VTLYTWTENKNENESRSVDIVEKTERPAASQQKLQAKTDIRLSDEQRWVASVRGVDPQRNGGAGSRLD